MSEVIEGRESYSVTIELTHVRSITHLMLSLIRMITYLEKCYDNNSNSLSMMSVRIRPVPLVHKGILKYGTMNVKPENRVIDA